MAAAFRTRTTGSSAGTYGGGLTSPALSASRRATRSVARKAAAIRRTPGSCPGRGGRSPRFEGASRIDRGRRIIRETPQRSRCESGPLVLDLESEPCRDGHRAPQRHRHRAVILVRAVGPLRRLLLL